MEVSLAPSVHRVATGNHVLLFDGRDGSFHSLNATAATVLDELLSGHDVSQAADNLARRYGISSGQARDDVTALVSQLAASQLVEQAP